MRQAFTAVLGEQMAAQLKIDTVDSFQGKQMDVIILSCVRASKMTPDRHTNTQALLGVSQPVYRLCHPENRLLLLLTIFSGIKVFTNSTFLFLRLCIQDDARSQHQHASVVAYAQR